MAVQANATFTFIDYEMRDDGVNMHFVCANPGPGQASDYYILLTDADVAGVTTQNQLKTLVTSKLQRKIRASGFASKLDPFVGQAVTV